MAHSAITFRCRRSNPCKNGDAVRISRISGDVGSLFMFVEKISAVVHPDFPRLVELSPFFVACLAMCTCLVCWRGSGDKQEIHRAAHTFANLRGLRACFHQDDRVATDVAADGVMAGPSAQQKGAESLLCAHGRAKSRLCRLSGIPGKDFRRAWFRPSHGEMLCGSL